MPALTPARRNRLILIILVLALLLWALYTARKALLPFIGGLIAGYIILPIVNFIDHRLSTVLRRTANGREASPSCWSTSWCF